MISNQYWFRLWAKIALLFLVTAFLFCSVNTVYAKGGGGRSGGARSTGSFKSSAGVNVAAGKTTSSSFGSKISSWFSQKFSSSQARLHSAPATATNNAYFSNGHYNGWTGIFWGYLLGRALSPGSTVANNNGVAPAYGEYEMSDKKQYAWSEPSVSDDIIAYGVLILFVRIIYKWVKRLGKGRGKTR